MIAAIFGLIAGAGAFAIKRCFMTAFVLMLWTWFYFYVGLPVFAFGFYDFPFYVFSFGLGLIFLNGIEYQPNNRALGFGLTFGVLGIFGLVVLPIGSSWEAFHADEYRNLVGDVESSMFSTDTSPVDVAQVRQVDQVLARKLAQKLLGADPGLGSVVSVGVLSIQLVNNQLYWVGPLNHSGFFKWLDDSKGTPGYVMVSATNSSDVKLVRKVGDKPIYLKYNAGSYMGDKPERHLYYNGYMTTGLADYTFEIDDTGRPFWVVTKYRRKVGYSGEDATAVVTLDPQTGVIKEYAINSAPLWIDRIQPEGFVTEQLEDWGGYIYGWWNAVTAKKGLTKPTKGMSLVYGVDGASYWYTGMSSVGSDKGTVGFVLVNTRTKEARMYKQSGATETEAMGSAKGLFQEKGYSATFPILYNVGGVPTYFTTLKDHAGLVKAVAWVSVLNYEIAAGGKNVREALRAYKRALNSKGNVIAPDGVVDRFTVSGEVLRIGMEIAGTETNYYFLVSGHENKLFSGSADISPEIVVTQKGDEVRLTFDDGGSSVIDVFAFDNLVITLQVTEAQIGVTERAEVVNSRVQADRAGQNADAAWSKMTPAEKAALMNKP